MITEDYVSFEIAKLLKEKRFDWDCQYCYIDEDDSDKEQLEVPTGYDAEIYSPTLQMAMKWLREKKLFVEIFIPSHSDHEDTIYHDTWSFDIFNLKTKKYMYCTYGEVEYNSYEEACEAAIKYCLKNLI